MAGCGRSLTTPTIAKLHLVRIAVIAMFSALTVTTILLHLLLLQFYGLWFRCESRSIREELKGFVLFLQFFFFLKDILII